MGNKGRINGNLYGVPLGVGCAVVMCLVGLAGITQMVITGKVGEKGVGIMIPAMLLLSSLSGCAAASATKANNQIIGNAVTSGILILIMAVTGLAIEGSFEKVLLNMGAVALGGVVSCVLCLKKPPKGMRRKRHYR